MENKEVVGIAKDVETLLNLIVIRLGKAIEKNNFEEPEGLLLVDGMKRGINNNYLKMIKYLVGSARNRIKEMEYFNTIGLRQEFVYGSKFTELITKYK